MAGGDLRDDAGWGGGSAVTRRSRRDIERRLDELQSDSPPASAGITIRHFAVDADGETVGETEKLRITHREDGTQTTERESYVLPNDRGTDQ